jgi:hypothetical protein
MVLIIAIISDSRQVSCTRGASACLEHLGWQETLIFLNNYDYMNLMAVVSDVRYQQRVQKRLT